MFSGEYIFSQVMDHLPMHTFKKCVERYSGNRYVKSFNCFDQFLRLLSVLQIKKITDIIKYKND
jgi:hypothetical protein